MNQTPGWEAEYRELEPVFERLASEVEFTLNSVIDDEGIKVHSVTNRVKSVKSIAEKSERKEIDDPLSHLNDIVGVRVVVLFRSDLPRLDELIRESFAIDTADDKITGSDPASFGYMSVHYIAGLHTRHSGPRYDGLKGIKFEIQTRTIVMDAWANVSHYLAYKGASSIPEDLRKDFFALSGLFYVADQHFEIFADRARLSQKRAREELRQDVAEAVEINLDTMEAFLVEHYKDRRHVDRASISEFVEEVSDAGYVDVGTLNERLDRAQSALTEYEERHPPAATSADGRPRFANLGAARIALALADAQYAANTSNDDRAIEEFALWT